MNEQPVYTADEFANEAHYLDTLVWEALVLLPKAKVLLCGYGPDGSYAQRAIDTGANITVIEHRQEPINQFNKLDAKLLRGSTSVIPAKDNSFDLAIAYHYLHEIDPFFHTQVLSELARVANRVAVVEPAPPGDPLGKRIALLYSQAKRELGQFEYYQPLEYWKKLLQGVKADVSQHVFAFAKVPPRHYLVDTIQLLLDTIEVEEAPREYMNELRQIAQRSDAQLLPPPRYVLVGAAVGDLLVPSFTPRLPQRPSLPKPQSAPAAVQTRHRRGKTADVSAEAGYEMPPVEAGPKMITPPDTIEPTPAQTPAAAPAPAAAPQPAPAPKLPPRPVAPPVPSFGFGAPPPPAPGTPAPGGAPFGMPFATPPGTPPETPVFGIPGGAPPANPGWEWEPPEAASEEPPPLP